jgi:hypothetical protein
MTSGSSPVIAQAEYKNAGMEIIMAPMSLFFVRIFLFLMWSVISVSEENR